MDPPTAETMKRRKEIYSNIFIKMAQYQELISDRPLPPVGGDWKFDESALLAPSVLDRNRGLVNFLDETLQDLDKRVYFPDYSKDTKSIITFLDDPSK